MLRSVRLAWCVKFDQMATEIPVAARGAGQCARSLAALADAVVAWRCAELQSGHDAIAPGGAVDVSEGCGSRMRRMCFFTALW